jgi:hypothetical protein
MKVWKSVTGGTISDVPVISIVWLLMVGDFQSRGSKLETRNQKLEIGEEGQEKSPTLAGADS